MKRLVEDTWWCCGTKNIGGESWLHFKRRLPARIVTPTPEHLITVDGEVIEEEKAT